MNREATQVRTPSADRPARVQQFTSSSTSAIETHVATDCGEAAGGWYTFVPTQDCHIIWGDSGVGAATTDQMFFAGGVEFSRWLHAKEDSHMRIIRNSADGALHWHKSES